jgi:hypothetical protein
MNNLATIDVNDYWGQSQYNGEIVSKIFDKMFPKLEIPYDCTFQILSYLSETDVNPQVIPKVIRGIQNILIGTGSGQVIVHVQKDLTNVSVRETDEEIKTKRLKKTS